MQKQGPCICGFESAEPGLGVEEGCREGGRHGATHSSRPGHLTRMRQRRGAKAVGALLIVGAAGSCRGSRRSEQERQGRRGEHSGGLAVAAAARRRLPPTASLPAALPLLQAAGCLDASNDARAVQARPWRAGATRELPGLQQPRPPLPQSLGRTGHAAEACPCPARRPSLTSHAPGVALGGLTVVRVVLGAGGRGRHGCCCCLLVE